MDCLNCKKPMQRVIKGHYHCTECNEVFKIDGDKQDLVKDKKEFFTNVLSEFEKFGNGLKELANKFIETKKIDDSDDHEAGMFM